MHLQTSLDQWLADPIRGGVWELPGVNIFTYIHDVLHICDKGSTIYILGTALFEPVQRNEQNPGTNLQARLDFVRTELEGHFTHVISLTLPVMML